MIIAAANASRWLRIALLTAIAIGLFLLNVSIGAAPNIDSESSWAEVLAWGAVHHAQWGKDIAFTYGPYGLLTPWYHHVPGAFLRFAFGQLLLAAAFCTCVIALLRRAPAAVLILFALASLCAIHRIPGDTAWALTLVFGTTALLATRHERASAARWMWLVIFALVSACIAQIKLSIAPIWLLCVGVLALHARTKRLDAAAIGLMFPAAFVALWLGAGQALGNLPTFLHNSLEITAGYGHAMGLRTDRVSECLGAICTLWFGVICLYLLWHFRRDVTATAMVLLYALVGALLWRANFTRADHAPWFFGSYALLPIGLLCHPLADRQPLRKSLIGLICVCALASLYGYDLAAWGQSHADVVLNPATRLAQNSSTLMNLLRQRMQHLLHLSEREAVLDRAWTAAAKTNDLPLIRARIGDSKVDVFTIDQGIALLNGFNYSPRPVFQSYSAYTAELARINEAHVLGSAAPPFVLMRLDAIDNRLPMSEDGLALIALLTHYRPVLKENGFLLLQRDESVGTTAATAAARSTRTVQIGSDVRLEHGESPVVASIQLELSWLGRLYSLLVREPPLRITLDTNDGVTHVHRLVRPTAASGFLISPIVGSIDDWTRLYLSMPLAQVVRFRIDAEVPWERVFFQKEFVLELRSLDVLHGDLNKMSAATGTSLMIYPGFNVVPTFVRGYARTYAEGGRDVAGFQAPASLKFEPAPGVYEVSATFGIQGGALSPGCIEANADGVGISLILHHGNGKSVLWHAEIDPFHLKQDSGPHRFTVDDVKIGQDDAIEVFIDPGHGGNNLACDWAYLRDLTFAPKNAPAPN